MLLLTLACAHRVVPDTGADGGPDTATEVAARCGAWSGVVRVGTRWTYEPTPAYVEAWGYAGQWTSEVRAMSPDVVVSTSGEYTSETGYVRWTRTETWRCDDDGVWWIRSDAASSSATDAGTSDVVGWRTFTPGWLVRPARPADSEETFALEFAVNGGAPNQNTVTCVTTVGVVEPREYAGQTFDTVEIVPVCDAISASSYRLALGIGLVETSDELLVAYEP